MSSPNLTLAARRIEDLPCDGGKVVDTLAGGVLRLFVKLHAVERRLAALEKRQGRPSARRNTVRDQHERHGHSAAL
jgi:hypothetical protein